MNLFPMLRARLGISIRSDADKLKFGLFTIFPCVQPAFRKAVAVEREMCPWAISKYFGDLVSNTSA
jgi:hypothetical protein